MVHETAERLAQAGLLTERQADVYFITQIAGRHRTIAASRLGISESAVDDHLARARTKINAARRTLRVLDEIEDDRDGDSSPTVDTDAGEGGDSDPDPKGSNAENTDVGHDRHGF